MQSQLTINKNTENTFSFEMTIKGTSGSDPKVEFVIPLDGYSLSFECNRTSDDNWIVTIPNVLSAIDETIANSYFISVIIDGYYFKPEEGTLLYTTGEDQAPAVDISMDQASNTDAEHTTHNNANSGDFSINPNGQLVPYEITESAFDDMFADAKTVSESTTRAIIKKKSDYTPIIKSKLVQKSKKDIEAEKRLNAERLKNSKIAKDILKTMGSK